MPEPGGSTAQSGFFYQNSVAAIFLAKMIGKPGAREAERISEVTNEASGGKVHVDDILVRFASHKRLFIQVKENIDPSGDAWEKMWHHILDQIKTDFNAEKDRIVLYIGNRNPDFVVLKELSSRALNKQSFEQWRLTNKDQKKLFENIRQVIVKASGQDLHAPASPNNEQTAIDDFIVSMLANVDVEIQTRQEVCESFQKYMPESSVHPAMLFRILRDYAFEMGIYNRPLEAHQLRRILREEFEIVIKGTEEITFSDIEPITVLTDDDQEFWMGDDGDPNASPRHKVRLPGYRISEEPVTKGKFAAFVMDNSTFDIKNLGWKNKMPSEDELNQPVTGVTFSEARLYCEWLSKQTDNQRKYRLPNEAEWEKAARGNDGRKYPWGDDWDLLKLEQENKSIFGCRRMVGSIFEWTCSLWGSDWQKPDKTYQYPWKPDQRNDPDAYSTIRRVIRGGPLTENQADLRCSTRTQDLISSRGRKRGNYGFRVVMEVE